MIAATTAKFVVEKIKAPLGQWHATTVVPCLSAQVTFLCVFTWEVIEIPPSYNPFNVQWMFSMLVL